MSCIFNLPSHTSELVLFPLKTDWNRVQKVGSLYHPLEIMAYTCDLASLSQVKSWLS